MLLVARAQSSYLQRTALQGYPAWHSCTAAGWLGLSPTSEHHHPHQFLSAAPLVQQVRNFYSSRKVSLLHKK